MADYIDRETLVDEIYKLMNPDSSDVVNKIYAQPSIDAVEVIRCKDCKHNGKPYCDLLTTGSRDWYINDNDYCKWGEKE